MVTLLRGRELGTQLGRLGQQATVDGRHMHAVLGGRERLLVAKAVVFAHRIGTDTVAMMEVLADGPQRPPAAEGADALPAGGKDLVAAERRPRDVLTEHECLGARHRDAHSTQAHASRNVCTHDLMRHDCGIRPCSEVVAEEAISRTGPPDLLSAGSGCTARPCRHPADSTIPSTARRATLRMVFLAPTVAQALICRPVTLGTLPGYDVAAQTASMEDQDRR